MPFTISITALAKKSKSKQQYKEFYDSIKIMRAKTTDQNNSLLSEIENLKAQLKDNSKCVTIPDSKPKVLAPGTSRVGKKDPGLSPLASAVSVFLVNSSRYHLLYFFTIESMDAPSLIIVILSGGGGGAIFLKSLILFPPKLFNQGIAAESTICEDNPFALVDNDSFINVFALEPSSKASSSGDLSLAESPYVTQTLHHLGKWSKDHPLDNIIGNPS
ncbi:hypothetical protein Tco_0838593 [Tanacetum coccineum]|uniref:Uncharacterized protein n=1 Tax=Tanacetum coccineum TaxID=301880 RepID=A0ABQ5AN80_9ASTR